MPDWLHGETRAYVTAADITYVLRGRPLIGHRSADVAVGVASCLARRVVWKC